MKTDIKFSVITICYNAEEYIGTTVAAVMAQTYDNFEYIIKDGMSDDNTMSIASDLTEGDKRVIFLQGKDKGIYDAMNIAVVVATGEYVIFLNAGDRFVNKNVLKKVSEHISIHDAEIFYGNVIETNGKFQRHLRIYTQKNSKLWYYGLGACLCHQSMFCRKRLFQRKLFNLNFKVCADRDWQMYFIKQGIRVNAMGFTIAEVLTEGFSQRHIGDLERETQKCVAQYCGIWKLLYKIILFAKENVMLRWVICKVEKIISCRYTNWNLF